MAVKAGNVAVARAIAAIAAIADSAWVDIDYTSEGVAQVAECTYKDRRLIVRRTRLTDTARARLWPDWRHHAFLTDLDGETTEIDAFHRHHAGVELAIRDFKEGAGLESERPSPVRRTEHALDPLPAGDHRPHHRRLIVPVVTRSARTGTTHSSRTTPAPAWWPRS